MSRADYNKAYYETNKERLKEAARKHYEENKERHAETNKAWYQKNKERARQNAKAWRDRNKERLRVKNLRRNELSRYHKRGITEEKYNLLLVKQNGVCAICKRECDVDSKLAIDHCHDRGVVRGLLCRRCNSGLGFFRENPKIIAAAFAYVSEHLEEW